MIGAKTISDATVRNHFSRRTFIKDLEVVVGHISFPEMTGAKTMFVAVVREVLARRTFLSIGKLFSR